MLATNIPLFQAINLLPFIFDPSRLSEGDGIEATLCKNSANLCKNSAKYHQSCRLLFNNTKLQRAQKGKLLLKAQQRAAIRSEEQVLIAINAFYAKK